MAACDVGRFDRIVGTLWVDVDKAVRRKRKGEDGIGIGIGRNRKE